MSRAEFLAWGAFYRLFPFDDLHRYYRPAAMIASAIGGGSTSDRVEWLQPSPFQHTAADLQTLRAFGITR